MITSIVLENFKCFRELKVQPRLITAFVGPNGSGKSSVLQALALLKQSLGTNGLVVTGRLVNLPAYMQLQPKFDSYAQEMRLGFGGRDDLPGPAVGEFGRSFEFSHNVAFVQGAIQRKWGHVTFMFKGVPCTLGIDNNGQPMTTELDVPGGKISVGQTSYIAPLLDIKTRPIGVLLDPLVRPLEHILAAPTRMLGMLRLVPAARGLTQPVYNIGSSMADDVTLAGGLTQIKQQTATNLGYSRPLEEVVSGWLKQVTGVGLRAKIVPSQAVEIEALTLAGNVNMVAEGFGANSLVLLLWQLANAPQGATLMVEEPEIHLHPRAQAELASLLADVAKGENKQIIMTTHSEHIVGRLLTLVAEKKMAVDELAIYAFEKDEQGVCTASQLEILADGRVVGGLKDFFEPELAELDRYVKALQAQK